MTSSYFSDYNVAPQILSPPSRALIVGAHPDDIEFGSGGTLAKWADAGTSLIFVILTDGSKGSWDPSVSPKDLAILRESEQIQAAKVLSQTAEVEFMRCVDGELKHESTQVSRVCELIRKHRPGILIGHDPWKRYRLHPDHRNAGFIVTDALVAARDPLYLPDLGRSHRPETLLLFEADEPNYVEELSPRNLAVKANALLQHASQHKSSMEIDQESNDGVANFISATLEHAKRVGETAGYQYGENFRLISDT